MFVESITPERKFTCAKCEGTSVKMRYVPDLHGCPEGTVPERLDCTCNQCDYRWKEKTSDQIAEQKRIEFYSLYMYKSQQEQEQEPK